MSKRALKKSKRRSRAVVPVLGITGLSMSLASGAAASTGAATDALSTSQPHEIFLGEEEVFDSSLSTFYTFDKENGTSLAQDVKLARGGGGGCGCGGGGHGGCGGGGGGCAAHGGCGGCARAGIGCARAGIGCARAGIGCARAGVHGFGRCAFHVHCRCAFFRRCFGCGCGDCGGWGCGTCWIWTPGWGWVNTCWGESTPPAKVAAVASEPIGQIASADKKK